MRYPVGGSPSLIRDRLNVLATLMTKIWSSMHLSRIWLCFADKLDAVLARVDAVNTRLARVAPLVKRFRQSVLSAATSGRLSADWRSGMPSNLWRQAKIQGICG